MGGWGPVPGASATLTRGWKVETWTEEAVKPAALETEAQSPPSPLPKTRLAQHQNTESYSRLNANNRGNSPHFSRELSLWVSRGPLGRMQGLEEMAVLWTTSGA